MLIETNAIVNLITSILFFPIHFQDAFFQFAWGVDDPSWLMVLKRIFLLLPVAAVVLGTWTSIASTLSVIIRHNRQKFITTLFITWWDLGKSIVSFWGGIFVFVFYLIGALVGLVKILILGIWTMIQEVLFFPVRMLHGFGQGLVGSSIPWIAVFLTLFWCLIEGVIFTYVTTPLVIDTFSNITGETLSINAVRIPLFIFLLFIVLGSYAVLATLIDTAKKKNISALLGIIVIEIIVLFVEVIFLYREFVDSLVPWFAQYSDNFELGIFWTLAIAVFAWFGIRSLSWFLFAAHGTPTILAVIQGRGMELNNKTTKNVKAKLPELDSNLINKVKQDMGWLQSKGEELMVHFMLPPLQVVAAAINFCTLLISGRHLFELPFRSMSEIIDSKMLIQNLEEKKRSLSNA